MKEDLEAIGELATQELQHRLEAIKVEEHALRRNFAELRRSDAPNEEKMRKLETLLHLIEAQEAALEHEAEFLNQGAPTTLEFVFRHGSRFIDKGASWMKRRMGGHHLLPHSPFVNTSIESLAKRFNLPEGDAPLPGRNRPR